MRVCSESEQMRNLTIKSNSERRLFVVAELIEIGGAGLLAVAGAIDNRHEFSEPAKLRPKSYTVVCAGMIEQVSWMSHGICSYPNTKF